jgi:hypothetical protein
MDPLETLAAGIKHVDALLDEDALEPDRDRDDWGRMKVRVGMVRSGIDGDVLGTLDAALAATDEKDVQALIERRVSALLGCAAALYLTSGDAQGAAALRTRAAQLTDEPERRAELEAGDREPDAWARLVHARWLHFHDQRDRADAVAKRIVRESKQGPLTAGARAILRAPRAIKSAPPLFRLNGCGVGLYGSRDQGQDGWYTATYCLCILWIPILPLTAYRVRQSGDGSYQFLAREALSPVARAIQLAGALAVVLGVGWGGASSYLGSPERKARVALDEARAAEAKGDRQAALERYSAVTHLEGASSAVSTAAGAVIRLSAAGVPDPCTAAAVDKVGRVVDAYYALPPAARDAAVDPIVKHLETWATQIGDGSPEQINAGLTVLDMAGKATNPGPQRAAVDARRAHLRRLLADKVAATRPLQALALCARPPADPEALTVAATLVAGLGTAPSLWIEAEHDITAWATAADQHAGLDAAARRAREQLQAAHAAHDADAQLIEAGDEKALAAALTRAPLDQELAVALAQIRRRRGETKSALATVEALGAPGRLTALAQQMLAACLVESGDLARADTVLTDLLAERLPAFQEAQRELEGAAEHAQKAILDRARAGDLDPEVKRRVDAASEDERPAIFRAWLSERLDADPGLKALRAEYLRHDAVVPASLALGTLKLRRASAATGDPRRALLAAAEKTFLSIHNEAEGNPSYHLGLGQVYHRLGRTEEGNTELSHVLDRKDPDLTLGVAHVYRELGLPVRAKQVAEGLWNSPAEERWKYAAATLMSHLVNETGFNEDEEETWLKRSDPTSPGVKLLLLRLEARRLRRQGKNAEADRAFGRLCEGYERDAAHDASASNNAAVSYLERYGATGDPAHLRAAVRLLESAHRLEPQNAINTGNLGDAVAHLAVVTVLDKWIKMRSLALDQGEATTVLDAVLRGPLREEAMAALRKDPGVHRSLDLAQEEQALAPQKQEGYERQLRWLSWLDDARALGEMEKRLAALPPFDASAIAEGRRSRTEKTKAALERTASAETVKRAEEMLARVEHGGHEPTLAAARLVVARHRSALARVERTPEGADAALDAARKAALGWPEGGMDDLLVPALVGAALVHAAADAPALAKVLDTEGRLYGTGMLLHRATSGPDAAAVLAALRRRPEMAEAVQRRKARAGKRPDVTDVVLARVSGDAELEQAAAPALQNPVFVSLAQIAATLAPGQEVEKVELALFQGGRPR